MYVNIPNIRDYNNQVTYNNKVVVNISNYGNYDDITYFSPNLSIKVKTFNDKNKIFELSKDFVYLDEEGNNKMNSYIEQNSVLLKGNIFDYYD